MRLQTENLTKSFGEKQVLKGVSFSAESGRALGLLGRNGAGKTTTIRIVMQVFSPDSRRVLLDGQPLRTDRVKIGYLPEERGLYPKKPIFEQLLYFGKLSGLSKKQAAAIYKIGVLMYGKPPKPAELFRALRGTRSK